MPSSLSLSHPCTSAALAYFSTAFSLPPPSCPGACAAGGEGLGPVDAGAAGGRETSAGGVGAGHAAQTRTLTGASPPSLSHAGLVLGLVCPHDSSRTGATPTAPPVAGDAGRGLQQKDGEDGRPTQAEAAAGGAAAAASDGAAVRTTGPATKGSVRSGAETCLPRGRLRRGLAVGLCGRRGDQDGGCAGDEHGEARGDPAEAEAYELAVDGRGSGGARAAAMPL